MNQNPKPWNANRPGPTASLPEMARWYEFWQNEPGFWEDQIAEKAAASAIEQASLQDPDFHKAVDQAREGKVVRRREDL